MPHKVEGERFKQKYNQALEREFRALDLLRRPEVNYADLVDLLDEKVEVTEQVALQVEVQTKYDGYLKRQIDEVEKQQHLNQQKIPENFDYDAVHGLSNELRQKLKAVKPETIDQASRISGITPAAISILMVHLRRK